eukprot:6211776-Pleurochrysis_carterae.AAC.2
MVRHARHRVCTMSCSAFCKAALHTIQDKHASQYNNPSPCTDPEALPAHPHPGTAPAGTRSQTATLAADKYIKSKCAYDQRTKQLLVLYAELHQPYNGKAARTVL